MPRIPTYQPGQVAPVQTTTARFRTPDMPDSGLGKGLQVLGEAMGNYARVQDHIDAVNDDTQARSLALEGQQQLAALTQQFSTLQGGNARAAQADVVAQMAKVREGLLAKAANPRMAKMFEERFAPVYADTSQSVFGHAAKQSLVERDSVLANSVSAAQDEAAMLAEQPDKFGAAIDRVRAAALEYAGFKGIDGSAYAKQQTGAVYAAATLNAIKGENVDLAEAMFHAHESDMTFEQRNQVLGALQKPLLDRDSAAGFLEVTAGRSPTAGTGGGTYQAPVEGRVSNTFAQHLARGSAGLDIAAVVGSAVHPVAGGTVIDVSEDPRSGKFVMVRHDDGHVSSYSHLGNQSVKKGDAVNASTVLGTVGMTGHTEGPHVHLRVRDAAGNDVDPEKLIGKQSAAVVGSPSAARNWDQASVIAAIEKHPEWSFEKKERVKAYARTRMNQDESTLSDQYADAADKAALFIAQRGGLIGSSAELPAAVRARMNPTKLAELDVSLKKANEAAATEKLKNSEDYWTLRALKVGDPEAFAKVPMAGYVGKLDPSQFRDLYLDQLEMKRKGNEQRAKFDPSTGVRTAITRGMRDYKIKLGTEDWATVAEAMTQRINDIYEQKKGIVTAQDYSQAFADQVRTIGYKSGNTGRVFKVEQVTGKEREALVAKFRQVNPGMEPTEEQLLTLFRATVGADRHHWPEVK